MDGWMGGWRHRHRRRPYLGTHKAIFSLTGCIISHTVCSRLWGYSELSDNGRLAGLLLQHASRCLSNDGFLFNQCELRKSSCYLKTPPASINQPT